MTRRKVERKKFWKGDEVKIVTGEYAGCEGVVVFVERTRPLRFIRVWIRSWHSDEMQRNRRRNLSNGYRIHIKHIDMVKKCKGHRHEDRKYELRAQKELEESKKPRKIRYPVTEENDSQKNEAP
jgi:ribosomal protein L24